MKEPKYKVITVTYIKSGKLITFVYDSFNSKADVIAWAKWSLKNIHKDSGIYHISGSGDTAYFSKNIRYSNKK